MTIASSFPAMVAMAPIALGRSVDKDTGSRGNYRMLETPPDEPIVQIQRVDHDSRVHHPRFDPCRIRQVLRKGGFGTGRLSLAVRLNRPIVPAAGDLEIPAPRLAEVTPQEIEGLVIQANLAAVGIKA
jgi:hypothetical protein